MILALALIVSAVAQINPDTDPGWHGPPVSLHAICAKGEDVRFYCYTRFVHATMKPGVSKGMCFPKNDPPDSFTHTWVPRLAKWLADHPETEQLSDREAASLAMRTVYPCHHP